MPIISKAQKDAVRALIDRLGRQHTSEELLDVFKKGKRIFFGKVLDKVQIDFELTPLNVKFIVISTKTKNHQKRFKIKLPVERKLTLEDLETMYTYVVLTEFNNPDRSDLEIACVHRAVFGDIPAPSVIFKEPVRLFVEYSGRNLSYVKTRDSDSETYRIIEHTPGTLDGLKNMVVSKLTDDSVIIRTKDPNFETHLLILDL